MGKKRRNSMSALKALAGETVKFARAQVVLDKTEAALEKELERERTFVPTTKVAKIRRKGENLIHSKHVLLAVVLLNIIDCILVLSELMLDIKYVTDLLTKSEGKSEGFIVSMKDLYPVHLDYLGETDIDSLHSELLAATITWKGSHDSNTTASASHGVHRRAAQSVSTSSDSYHNGTGHGSSHHGGHHHEHSLEETIAHALHKASISILGILVVETFFKIFCIGSQMKEHKLECFDAVIVVASFIVDIVLIQGLQQFDIQEFVLILAFLVPWRVIRVVNSLVVAIMDHEHFRLKLLYKQKKKISNELKESKTEIKGLKACIDALEKMCIEAGIPPVHVKAKLNMYRKVTANTNVTGAFTSFAVGGEAMMKPIPVAQQVEIPIHEENHNTKVQDLQLILKPEDGTSVTTLVNQSTDIAGKLISGESDQLAKALETARPRSVSAVEPMISTRDAVRNEEKESNVGRLAETSVSFISTINTDEGTKTTDDKSQNKEEADLCDDEGDVKMENGKIDGNVGNRF